MEDFIFSEGWLFLYWVGITVCWGGLNAFLFDDDDAFGPSLMVGILWGAVLLSSDHSDDAPTSVTFFTIYSPLISLILVLLVMSLQSLHKKKLVDYDFLIYAVPILLTLSLFFI